MANTINAMINDKTIKRRDTGLYIDLADIHFEDGFNLRDPNAIDADGVTFQDSINNLEAYLAEGGVVPAIEVRPREEGGVLVVDGHCRTLAHRQLLAHGKFPEDPKQPGKNWVAIVPFVGNDLERLARIYTSQNNRKLTDLEKAAGFKRFQSFGYNNEQIGKAVGLSGARVGQLLLLLNEGSAQVHQMIKDGQVSATTATQVVKKHGEKAGAVLMGALEKMQDKTTALSKGGKKPGKITQKVLAAPKESPWKSTADLSAIKEGYELLIFVRSGTNSRDARRVTAKLEKDDQGQYWQSLDGDAQYELEQVSHYAYMPAEPAVDGQE